MLNSNAALGAAVLAVLVKTFCAQRRGVLQFAWARITLEGSAL
jgi:hypothetical protein